MYPNVVQCELLSREDASRIWKEGDLHMVARWRALVAKRIATVLNMNAGASCSRLAAGRVCLKATCRHAEEPVFAYRCEQTKTSKHLIVLNRKRCYEMSTNHLKTCMRGRALGSCEFIPKRDEILDRNVITSVLAAITGRHVAGAAKAGRATSADSTNLSCVADCTGAS